MFNILDVLKSNVSERKIDGWYPAEPLHNLTLRQKLKECYLILFNKGQVLDWNPTTNKIWEDFLKSEYLREDDIVHIYIKYQDKTIECNSISDAMKRLAENIKNDLVDIQLKNADYRFKTMSRQQLDNLIDTMKRYNN